jgi:hypothetical protein
MALVRPSLVLAALSLGLAGCSSHPAATSTCVTAACSPAIEIGMDFTGKSGFYGAPYPTDARPGAAGLEGFPNPDDNTLVQSILTILQGDAGSSQTPAFSTTSAIFFQLSAMPAGTVDLPTVNASVEPSSSVVLLGIDPTSPDYLKRYPLSAALLADGGPFGAPALLSLLPLQGVPLRPVTRYAAVVMTSMAAGIAPSPSMSALASGARPDGISDAGFATYGAALQALAAAKIDVKSVAALAAFTTGSPLVAMGKVVAAMNASPPSPSAPWTANEIFPTYCVYSTTIPMPEYQGGTPPYTYTGGNWVFDTSGNPVLQRMEEANFYVTIPRQTMPANGFPTVVLSRTGAGGNRPLVDRGAAATNGGPAIVPGSGPAMYYAQAGFAGSEIDGPLGGLRNPTNANEDFTVFNVGNPAALRDNIRQSAAELALQAHILDGIAIDVSGCPGAVAPDNMARFDTGTMALMGHSMGATISPLTLAFEPRYQVGLLSGCGGSLIENVVYKQLPVPVLGLADVLVGVASSGYMLNEHDPLLSLFQWATEVSDPPIYSRLITLEPQSGPPRAVLMMQGIVDHYIMPPIADAMSLSLGLDLAGPELDSSAPEIATLDPVGPFLPLVGSSLIGLPASNNLTSKGGAKVSAVLTQNPSDGIEDGHEVVFQTEGPKHQYVCFLGGLLGKGTPTVPTAGTSTDPCQ